VARVSSVVRDLRAATPPLHGDGECFGLAWDALDWLEREVRPGMATLETGCGLSTIVFAASAADHEAIAVDAREMARVEAECAARGIDSSHVRFHLAPSHEVLPAWEARPLDLVLIDGAHGFPYPILDWWYLAPHVALGGAILVDDVFLPPVAVLADYLRRSDAWVIEGVLGDRTMIARKRSEELPSFGWRGEAVGSRVSFRHVPVQRRPLAALVYRVAQVPAALAGVRRARALLQRGR